jgi:hypothetical protein
MTSGVSVATPDHHHVSSLVCYPLESVSRCGVPATPRRHWEPVASLRNGQPRRGGRLTRDAPFASHFERPATIEARVRELVGAIVRRVEAEVQDAEVGGSGM